LIDLQLHFQAFPVLETVPVWPRPAKRPRHASSLFLVGPTCHSS